MCNCWSWWWINKHSHVGQFDEHTHGCTCPALLMCPVDGEVTQTSGRVKWEKQQDMSKHANGWWPQRLQRRVEPPRAERCQLQGGWDGGLSSTPSVSSTITHFLELIFPIALGSELSPSYLMRRETQGRGVTGLTPDAEAPHLRSVLVRAGWGSGPST